jgi:tetratricopeptide (TPR) repeat protein
LGLTLLRGGQPQRAVTALQQAGTEFAEWKARDLCHAPLALAYLHLGQPEAARQALAQTEATYERWTLETLRGKVGFLPVPWSDWVEGRLFRREAWLAVHGREPPDDPRWHAIRGRSLQTLREGEAAAVEFRQARVAPEDEPRLRILTTVNDGQTHARAGRWDRAAEAFAWVNRWHPDLPEYWDYRAAALLASGDWVGHRRVSRAMFDQFRATTNPRSAFHTVKTLVARPDVLDEAKDLLPLARLASRFGAGSDRLEGGALYRAGRHAEAVKHLDEGASARARKAWDWLFLALAQSRLGRHEEALRALTSAEAWIATADRQEPAEATRIPGSKNRTIWTYWNEPIEVACLLREARQVVRGLP